VEGKRIGVARASLRIDPAALLFGRGRCQEDDMVPEKTDKKGGHCTGARKPSEMVQKSTTQLAITRKNFFTSFCSEGVPKGKPADTRNTERGAVAACLLNRRSRPPGIASCKKEGPRQGLPTDYISVAKASRDSSCQYIAKGGGECFGK